LLSILTYPSIFRVIEQGCKNTHHPEFFGMMRVFVVWKC